MYVHRSNRTEELLDALCELLATPAPNDSGDALASVFEPECIVVQGPGMERWLGLELSRRLGIWSNPSFPFPRTLLERAMESALGPVEDPGISFEPETLTWSIAAVLPGLLGDAPFAPLERYLRGDTTGEKLLQLAERIAHVFDRYVIYRPDLVRAWEHGRDAAAPGLDVSDVAWQSELWRALISRHGAMHLGARMAELLGALADRDEPLEGFPRRLSIFGISTLPPLYLRGLAALARHSEVHLFVLSPSREYWADIRSGRERLRGAGIDDVSLLDPDALHFEEGNPLLASLGRLGREFQALVEDGVDYREGERDLYREPESASMLATLQADVLNLRRRSAREGDEPPLDLEPDDGSIAVHACHGPMREAEVLRDQLLALFAADPGLEPRDVVVMTPDIETYAPYLEAAFGGSGVGEAKGGRVRIPCRIADRSVRATHPVVESLSRLLALLGSRMKASAVLDVLAGDAVRARFGLGAEDDAVLRRWVVGSGIRWGVDDTHRRDEGQPAATENTWRFGLDRLLLGRALDVDGAAPFADRTASDEIEGDDAERLGRLADFCETLFSFRSRAARPQPWSSWRALLDDLLGAMIHADHDTAHELQQVREALRSISERVGRAGFDAPLSLAVVREQLERAFRELRPSSGFLSGGVTFCEMVPMRSIPFRIVCLLGMGDEAFPRIRRPQSFDLVAQRRRIGDRSSRDDDRYLFLEALLSARDRLIVTYPGQDVRSNVELPPSVVVGELLDQLSVGFVPPGGHASPTESAKWMRERLVLRHPLQPFSPRYFGADTDDRLFSYAESWCEGARVIVGDRIDVPPFLPEPVDPSEPLEVLEIDALVDWLKRPTRHFLRHQLGVRLEEEDEALDDREPMTLTGLLEWRVGDALLERAVAERLDEEALAVARASGLLPLGTPGAVVLDDLGGVVSGLAAKTRALTQQGALPSIAVDARLDGVAIRGTLDELFECGQVRHHYNKLERSSEIEVWVRHLVLGWIAPPDHPRASHLVGRSQNDGPAHVIFRPVDDAERRLRDLLDLYRLGRTTALPLFASSARTYATKLRAQTKKRTPEEQATLNAYESYRGSESGDFRRGERDEPELRLVFGAVDPLAPGFSPSGDPEARDGFRALARRVFDPLLDHREDAS
jgi:exodeoxyribonuclease V gamma subunit